jgi:radical SAM protein with 4Fe4S-binding SPASM domain
MKRIVWDPEESTTYLTGAYGRSRQLSGPAGALIGELRSEDVDAVARCRATHPSACASLERAGLLDAGSSRYVRVPRGPHLKRVQIELLGTCNLACSYCFSSRGPSDNRRLTTENVLSVLAECSRLGVLAVDFTGGEPLLDPAFGLYAETARAAGMSVFLQTNGTLLDAETVDHLDSLGLAGVQISVDSHLQPLNDSSRGLEGALSKTLKGIELVYQSRIPLQITLMIHRGNVETVVESIRYFSTRYRRSVINVDRVMGRRSETVVPLTGPEYWRALRPYIARNVRAKKLCETPAAGAGEPACGVAYSLVYITSDGEVAACPTLTSRDNSAFAGPNLGDGVSLESAWYDSLYFNSFRYTNCGAAPACPVGQQCGGGCRSNAYEDSGSITAPDLVECNLRKNPTRTWIDFLGRYDAADLPRSLL